MVFDCTVHIKLQYLCFDNMQVEHCCHRAIIYHVDQWEGHLQPDIPSRHTTCELHSTWRWFVVSQCSFYVLTLAEALCSLKAILRIVLDIRHVWLIYYFAKLEISQWRLAE